MMSIRRTGVLAAVLMLAAVLVFAAAPAQACEKEPEPEPTCEDQGDQKGGGDEQPGEETKDEGEKPTPVPEETPEEVETPTEEVVETPTEEVVETPTEEVVETPDEEITSPGGEEEAEVSPKVVEQPRQLARTGASPFELAIVAAALIALGGGIVHAARPKRRHA